jgi:hypothetical protein
VISVLLAVALAPPPGPIETQQSTYAGSDAADKYRVLYGDPMYWSLSLLVGPDADPIDRPRVNQAIETRGVLKVVSRAHDDPAVSLCDDTLRYCLPLPGPAPEIRAEFFADAPFRHLHAATVTGAFTNDQGFIYWRIDSAPRRERPAAAGRQRALEQVVRDPGRFAGAPVTLRGGFGGAAQRGGWLLRDGKFFVRVTGREPRGRDWRLDGRSASDCVWQLEVQGKLQHVADEVVLAAREVRLVGRDPEMACGEGRPR